MSPSQFRVGCAGPQAEPRWDAEQAGVFAASRLGLGLVALAGERKAQTRSSGLFKSTVEARTRIFVARTGEDLLAPAAIRAAC
jgi:hypothetical protein